MDDRSMFASLAGALAGRYEIDREIGRGGMATVYLARDVRHSRPVALKLLSPELGAILGAERFLSEIRVTANLQHPNLLPLFDSGEASGLLFYVMPYVEGESLRARLDREKQLPVEEGVRIAVAIASALDYAHRHGVIHRDLKPENILLHDGQPLVADFGIALAVSNAGSQRVTQTGLSLGTPQYMSPEQATGDRSVDGRTDIYSLGAVTYEMLAGEPPHSGTSAQAIIARLMTEEPRPLTVVRRSVPLAVEAAVRHALEKLPADRFATAKEFADALQGRGAPLPLTAASHVAPAAVPLRRRAAMALATGALGVVVGGLAVGAWRSGRAAPAHSIRFTVDPPVGLSIYDGGVERPFAIAPNGESVVFTAGPQAQLYHRRFDQLDPSLVAKVERPVDLRFSSNGEAVAYQRSNDGALMKVAVSGGESGVGPTEMAPGVLASGISWAPLTDVVYAKARALWRVSAGGTPRQIAAMDTSMDGIWTNPSVLSDGKTIAFRVSPPRTIYGTADDRLALESLDGGPRTLTTIEMQNALGYFDGYLIYGGLEGRLMGVPLDLRARKLGGDPMVLLDNVAWKKSAGVTAALSANGTIAYLTGNAKAVVQLVDEHGATTATLSAEPHNYTSVSWSPDGKRLLLGSEEAGFDLWLYDMESHVTTRLTQSGDAVGGVWTPDGQRIAFLKLIKGVPMGYSVPADGSTAPEPLPAAAVAPGSTFSITPDGKYLLSLARLKSETGPRTAPAHAIPMDGKGEPIPILEGAKPGLPEVSPNGKWIAYVSIESGRPEVYVRAFPSGAGRLQVSSNSGSGVKWSPDGRRLTYRSNGAYRAAVLDFNGAMPRLVRTDSLFPDVYRPNFGLHPDGKHIAVMRDAGEGARLVVVTNWIDEALAKLRKTR